MNQILKSKIDNRIYKAIELPNKLLCLLVSDKDTEKSAAAMNVDIGSLADPIERQGLAHFCEHMLFMGTEKYPSESEYSDYISKNSGATNAFTSELNTNYIFQVANNSFQGALDRFAQFFIAPLFDDSCTEREMKAVNSEFNMNLQNDFWRKFQIFHNSALPGNPYQKFMIGNLKTLQHPDTRQQLLDFHKKYYSSNVMRLVVYGSQPIDQLEQWTQDYFTPIVNKDLPSPQYPDHPFNETNTGKLYRYVPIKDQDFIEISWIMEYLQPHYRNCPGKYISHLIGHEGENSLLSQLIREDLAQELSSGPHNEMKRFSLMNVRIKLTKKGLANYQLVLRYVFEYVAMLKQKGTQKWIFDETKAIKKLEFDFLEKSKPFDYVSSLASRLQLYPAEEALVANYLMDQYDEKQITDFINQLNTTNLVIMLSSQEFTGKLNQKEEHFGTEYSVEDFSEELRQHINTNVVTASLNLPVPNTYIPLHTEVLPADDTLPEFPNLVFESEQTSVYFKQDNQFRVPKSVIQLRIMTNDLGYGRVPLTEVLAKLWHTLLKNHMREFNYLAEMAYIDPSIQLANNGVEISITGFSDSISRFSNGMFKKILEFNVNDYKSQFPTAYLKLQQELENFKRQPPYQQVHSYTSILLRDGGTFDPDLLLSTLKLVKFEDLIYFQQQWLKTCQYEWLITGNLTVDQAKQIAIDTELLFNAATLPRSQVLQIRALNIPINEVYNFSYNLKEPTETNSAVVVHFQQETGTLRSQIINDILATIIKNPFFQQLRTVEQLGYAVFSMISDIRGVTGFNFLIQSNSNCPVYVQQRMRLFIKETLRKSIEELTDEQFQEYTQSVKVSLLEKDYSLNKESGRFWVELQRHMKQFNRKQLQLEILPTITKQETQAYFIKHFIEFPKQVEIHAISPTHVDEQKQGELLSKVSGSVDWIKRRLPLYPDYYSLL